MLMNWEQTDRVRAETANDSSSEGASGDSIRFPLRGRGMGGASLQAARVAASLRSPGDVHESLRGGPQAPCSFQEGSKGASPIRSQSSVGGGVKLLPPEVRRHQKHEAAKGQKRGSSSSDNGPHF